MTGLAFPPLDFWSLYPPFLPYSHLSPLLSSANTTPLWANLRSSTSPVTGSGHGNTERDKGRATEEGETCALSHFLGGASVVDGKRMHCGLLEEPDMDSTGQSCSTLVWMVLRKTSFCSETLCKLLLLLFWMSQTFSAVTQSKCLDDRLLIYYLFFSIAFFVKLFKSVFGDTRL